MITPAFLRLTCCQTAKDLERLNASRSLGRTPDATSILQLCVWRRALRVTKLIFYSTFYYLNLIVELQPLDDV